MMRDREPGGESDADQIRSSLSDPEAFAVLFERHAGPVHRYLVKRVGPVVAEDLAGEVFATAFRSRANYDLGRPDARPWLFGMATNLANHHWRSEGRRRHRELATGVETGPCLDPSEEAVSHVFFEGHAEPIAQALAHLDGPYLDVLLLIAGPGFTYEEVAVALDIPVGTVRSRLSRARLQLRELLGPSGQYLGEEPQVLRTSTSKEGLQ
jgi:RNA polymerase sigma-70 factor (ECF subfamily)